MVNENQNSGGLATESLVLQGNGSLVGRALDAAVAERLMGFRWCVYDTKASTNPGRLLKLNWEALPKIGSGLVLASGDEPIHRSAYWGLPAYSTDITAAMEVVNTVRKRLVEQHGRSADFTLTIADFENEPPAYAEFDIWDEDVRLAVRHKAQAGTPAEAICRAALAAVESRVPAN